VARAPRISIAHPGIMIPIRGSFGIIYEAVSGPLQLSGEPRFGWEEVVVIAGLPWVEPRDVARKNLSVCKDIFQNLPNGLKLGSISRSGRHQRACHLYGSLYARRSFNISLVQRRVSIATTGSPSQPFIF
jgi:hypothetical protein